MSNVGRWDAWYANDALSAPGAYADTPTYAMGAEWLKGCPLVEDWGCGRGWMSQLIEPGRYRGIDGSQSPWADEIVDLAEYRSEVPGIYMRHVLEHNWEWAAILDNAVASFTDRMVLVLFTPLVEDPKESAPVDLEPDAAIEGVPTLSFRESDILARIHAGGAYVASRDCIPSAAFYGTETVYYTQKGRV